MAQIFRRTIGEMWKNPVMCPTPIVPAATVDPSQIVKQKSPPKELDLASRLLTHLWITSEQKAAEGRQNNPTNRDDSRHNYRAAWRQSRTLMKVQFPQPQVSTRRDCICGTITLSQSKEASFKQSVRALSGANNHSSLSHCVTEVLNPPLCSAHHLTLNRLLGVTLQTLRWATL